MHLRKNPITINEGFTCLRCKMEVKPHTGGSCRNHCPYCLYSLHVDKGVPGDRESECGGLMKPVGVEVNKKKGTRLIHVCGTCGVSTINRVAEDDNWGFICELSRIPQRGRED